MKYRLTAELLKRSKNLFVDKTCELLIVSDPKQDPKKQMGLKELSELSKQYNDAPILLKQGGKIHFYGNLNNQWQLTSLNLPNDILSKVNFDNQQPTLMKKDDASFTPFIAQTIKQKHTLKRKSAHLTFKAQDPSRVLHQLNRDVSQGGGYKVNHTNFTPYLDLPSAKENEAITNQIVSTLFPAEQAEYLKTIHCQNPTYTISSYCLNDGSFIIIPQAKKTTMRDNNNAFENDIYVNNHKIYISASTNNYQVKINPMFASIDAEEISEENLDLLNHSIEAIFACTPNGYKLVEIRTNSMMLYDRLMGIMPTTFDWFKNRDHNTWTWQQKNFKIFEPLFKDSYIEPLSYRIKNAFHRIFANSDPHRDDTEAFFDWPSNNNHPLLKLGEYLLTARFLAIPKNIIKGIVEFIPAMLQETAAVIMDKCKRFFTYSNNQKLSLSSILAGISLGISTLIYYGSKLTSELTMRVTSPIRAAKEAFELGVNSHSKTLGYALGGLSTLVSLGAIGLIGLFCAPLILASMAANIIQLSISLGQTFAVLRGLGAAWSWVSSLRQQEKTHEAIDQAAAANKAAKKAAQQKNTQLPTSTNNTALTNETLPTTSIKTAPKVEKLRLPIASIQITTKPHTATNTPDDQSTSEEENSPTTSESDGSSTPPNTSSATTNTVSTARRKSIAPPHFLLPPTAAAQRRHSDLSTLSPTNKEHKIPNSDSKAHKYTEYVTAKQLHAQTETLSVPYLSRTQSENPNSIFRIRSCNKPPTPLSAPLSKIDTNPPVRTH